MGIRSRETVNRDQNLLVHKTEKKFFIVKAESTWEVFTDDHANKIIEGSNKDIAGGNLDFKFREDIALVKELGVRGLLSYFFTGVLHFSCNGMLSG